MRHAIIPPYLLANIAASDAPHIDKAKEAAANTLAQPRPRPRFDRPQRASLDLTVDGDTMIAQANPAPDRTIYDAHNTQTLPGMKVRGEDDAASSDKTVNEAFDGLGDTYAFWQGAYGRDSIDGQGEALLATVHYGRDYDNAFWNGEQMVFGDGDGQVFSGFTDSLSVIAHELAHGVTQASGGLDYSDQPGALNESISDVFGVLTEQYKAGQTVDEATWLVGEGIFTPRVNGKALRSMKEPGTAYDDPVLGKDPQPSNMSGYVDTTDDNGGVHINSGIANHAFYLAATEIGGHAWEKAGLVWYKTLTSGKLAPTTDFAAFAAATTATAVAEYGEGSKEADAVRNAWATVGVTDGNAPADG